MGFLDWIRGHSQEPPLSISPSQPGAGPAAITLLTQDEATARRLCQDDYFLIGRLMSDPGNDAKRFLAEMKAGKAFHYEVRRNSITGQCEVKMMMKS